MSWLMLFLKYYETVKIILSQVTGVLHSKNDADVYDLWNVFCDNIIRVLQCLDRSGMITFSISATKAKIKWFYIFIKIKMLCMLKCIYILPLFSVKFREYFQLNKNMSSQWPWVDGGRLPLRHRSPSVVIFWSFFGVVSNIWNIIYD